jgi:hypothetical protein
MPEFLKQFFQSLTPEQKEKVWEWADSDEGVIDEIIELVAGPTKEPVPA